MAQDRLSQIAEELCRLFDQQIKMVSTCTFLNMTEAEIRDYQSRRARIDQLRTELASFEHRN